MKYFGAILAFVLCFFPSELLAQCYQKSDKEANLEAMASFSGIYQKNSSIWCAGNRIDKEDLSAMEGFDFNLYSKGRKKAGVGTALISIGAASCILGTAGLVGTLRNEVRIDRKRPGVDISQLAMLFGYGTGILFEAVGISLHCSGKADIRHAAVSYNGQKCMQLSIGPSSSGFGIALNF